MKKRDLALTNIIVVSGIVWGVIEFLRGLAASFTLGANDTVWSILLLIAVFLFVLPISILAIWKPKVSAILLVGCLAYSELILLSLEGFHGIIVCTTKLAFHIVFTCGYVYVACVRGQLDLRRFIVRQGNEY